MDDTLEQAKKKADECQMALNDELDMYTLSRFRPSATRLSDRFLATNRKAFHRKQMRFIVNGYFNKEEGAEPTMPLSQQAAFPSQNLAPTLAEYRGSRYYRELFKKKSDEFMAALINELDTYIQTRFRSSVTGRDARFFANVESIHRQQMLLLIDEFFSTEEDDLQPFPSTTTVPSANQINVASNQESAQVDTTPASPSISPVTPGDQQLLVNSGEVQVEKEPIKEGDSTRPRVDNTNTIENTANISTTEQSQIDYEDYCGCEDCQRQVHADGGSAVNPPELDNLTAHVVATPNEINNNNPEIDEAINLHSREKGQIGELQSEVQQEAIESIAVNSNIDQVDNSNVNDNNLENLDDSQAMDFNEGEIVDELAHAEPIIDAANDDSSLDSISSVDLGRFTRFKRKINYAEDNDDSFDESSTVNLNGERTIPLDGVSSTPKRGRVEPVVAADEQEDDNAENEEEEVGVEAAPLTVIVHHLNCPEVGCTDECPDQVQLIAHLLSKHQIEEFRCKVKDCALSFATRGELINHRKSVHGKLTNLPCAKCEVTFKSYDALSIHIWRYHEEGEYHCSDDKCQFTGKTRSEVYNHHYKHRSAKYACTFANCTASFNYESHLIIHLRIHTQEKPFACDVCPKAFNSKGQLTIHQRIHSGLKPYRCTWRECDYSASSGSSVNAHVRIVHFGLPPSKKEQAKRRIIDNRHAGNFIKKMPTN